MEFKIECPWCNQHYSVDASFIGQNVECSVCEKEFTVRKPDDSAAKYDSSKMVETLSSNGKMKSFVSPASDDVLGTAETQSSKGKMKALVCEMCGSRDLIKENGLFVCQSCGIKYSLEEARKMMIDGTVNVVGTVKVDMSAKLKNLYTIARRAKEENNRENAEKYYDMILQEDPESWEASFYQVYFKAMSAQPVEIAYAANSINNSMKNVLNLILQKCDGPAQRKAALSEVTNRTTGIALMFVDMAFAYHNMLKSQASDKNKDFFGNLKDPYFRSNILSSAQLCYSLGDLLVPLKEMELSCFLWKTGINIHVKLGMSAKKALLKHYVENIKIFEPDYKCPTRGCYVATAVYGAYDCPEVWTLRRFRDFYLGNTWYGRLFIKMYYAVSPKLVKHFGHTRLFHSFWRKKLDTLVKKLNGQGISDAPYVDRDW